MTYPPKTPIGIYEIIRFLGKGAMGEVYLALDTNLARKVAIKFLIGNFDSDSDELRRFFQEARAVSALEHPNIITVYSLSEHEGKHFTVTQYIDGETLRERIKRENKIPIMPAIEIAIQIVAGLTAAHEKGIVHRDIKPANIMIDKKGVVKVLDFGLATLTDTRTEIENDFEEQDFTWIETLDIRFMGTPLYASPEQALFQQEIDSRTDIFSFGVVFYQMLTSQPPFNRKSPGELFRVIANDEPPPIKNYVPDIPDELLRIIDKTLRKDPNERYQKTKNLLNDLKKLEDDLRHKEKPNNHDDETIIIDNSNAEAKGSKLSTIYNYVSWAVILVGIAFILWTVSDYEPVVTELPPGPFTAVEIANWMSAPRELYGSASFSPDGEMIAFGSTKSGTKSIWIKPTNSEESLQITKDQYDNRNPLFSPDGKTLAFFSARGDMSGIWQIPALFGGQPKLVVPVSDLGVQLKYWAKSGKIYYESNHNIYAVDDKTGETKSITNFDSKDKSINFLNISWDEKLIAYALHEGKTWQILTQEVGKGESKQIANTDREIKSLVWHPDGKRIVFSALAGGISQLFVAGMNDKVPRQISFSVQDSIVQAISSDGSKMVFRSTKEESDLWQINTEDQKETIITTDSPSELWSDVSPDSKSIVYQSAKYLSQGNTIFGSSILSKSISEDAKPLQLAKSGFLPKWSYDGAYVAFKKMVGGEPEIWVVKSAGGNPKQITKGGIQIVNFTMSPYNRGQAKYLSWSPTENTIAYIAKRKGKSNVWMVPADGSTDTQLTSNGDENLTFFCPIWSADGKKIAFSSETKRNQTGKKKIRELHIFDTETKQTKKILEINETIRLLGWSQDEKELIYALSKKAFSSLPPEVFLFKVSIDSGEKFPLNTLKNAYFYNIRLSPDRKNIAFTSRLAKNDDIWIVSADGKENEPRKLTRNNDPRHYFSCISWAPDGKSIFFDKQLRYSLLMMITDFE